MLELNTLRAHLVRYASKQQTVSYQQLVTELAIKPPRSINTLTNALERITSEDALLQQPILAAIAVQKGNSKIPRDGFFAHLTTLGIYEGPENGPVAEMWHLEELHKVWKSHSHKK